MVKNWEFFGGGCSKFGFDEQIFGFDPTLAQGYIYIHTHDDFCLRHLIKARFNFSMLISFFDFSHDNIILVKDLSNNARRAAIGSLDMCFEI